MLMGFGCTVPAMMATRTLASERDRKMTIFLTPFMSCSAKIPIYTLFTAAFFAKYQALVMISLYVIGIVLGALSVLIMKKTMYKGAPVPFVMEIPNYRFPSVKTVLLLLWDKSKDFIQRVCTIIFIATVIIWFLQSFDIRLNHVTDSADSILAIIGQGLSVIFAPIGFSDWRVSTGLITGFLAKEAIISTLAVLTGASISELGDTLHTLFTPLAAFSFLVFTLLYTPCVAAVATVRRELGSLKGTFIIILYQTGFAWLVAFAVYQTGSLFSGG
jgi:ferrous iron transport protein B